MVKKPELGDGHADLVVNKSGLFIVFGDGDGTGADFR
jgi:hypothetical protein